MRQRRYVTAAIDYPNAAPHMGHVLEKVLADVLARRFRASGDDVRFQIGTDEHGVKIQQTAMKEGVTPEALVDRNVPLFADLYRRMNISADLFLRTSDRPVSWPNIEAVSHRPTVEALWMKLRESGMLEKRTYTGLYCPGCERFITEKELIDGKCPDHDRVPDKVEEENWFFLLSRETQWLKSALREEYRIVPAYRSEEMYALLERGLEDVSFSRPRTSLQWGIPVPDDSDQTMYVWCDALTNYLSGIGYFTDHAQEEWWNDAEITHVIGKDIARFHALIWPAMLKSAGVRIPDRLLMHGFITNEGRKMSKSLGNVVVPDDVLARFGGNPDPLRFFLCHEIPVGRDGDFSWKRFEEIYDAKLRNQLGNMLNRVLVMLNKEGGRLTIPRSDDDSASIAGVWDAYGKAFDACEVHTAIQGITAMIDVMNAGFNDAMPWKLEGEERIGVLSRFAESLRHCALMLLPFVPDTAYRMSRQLNVPYADEMLKREFAISEEMRSWGGCAGWTAVNKPEILFPPVS